MAQSNGSSAGTARRARRAGLMAGPAVAVLMLAIPAPEGLPSQGWAAAAIGVLMAIWWMTEALPLAVTALVPLALFPVISVGSLETTAENYAHPLIFLFLGGFIIARAMERWGLHRRLALRVIRIGGRRPGALVASMMVATAFLSMWISNTAAAMVMLPIGTAVVSTAHAHDDGRGDIALADFSAALMLGIAYAATIGGMGTLIGTPPNALLAGFLNENYDISISFARWMLLGIPVVLVLLPVAWLVLTRVAFRVRLDRIEAPWLASLNQTTKLGPISRGELLVATVMVAVAVAWIVRPFLNDLFPAIPLSDTGIAVIGAIVLFVIPVDWSKGEFLLTWTDLAMLRWDVLILFGGGLALAGAIGDSGLADWIGAAVAAQGTLSTGALILLVMLVVVYLGELASNTAMAAIFLPVAAAAAVAMGESVITLALPVALAASLGFMLPVATPPNAIVFGSGSVTPQQMLRAGAVLDVVSVAVVAGLALTLGRVVFAG